ncbi:hypothetical protein X797_009433 [Metarhizium robertsii]|uniref:Collagen triple helix repeat protein n=1 Tax=Metarhizium robertsii TaxID=568076 RepID=A0A014N9W0_9HYPO|nr:hypothetical protein X797_009433 [Metarhizium robertsii]
MKVSPILATGALVVSAIAQGGSHVSGHYVEAPRCNGPDCDAAMAKRADGQPGAPGSAGGDGTPGAPGSAGGSGTPGAPGSAGGSGTPGAPGASGGQGGAANTGTATSAATSTSVTPKAGANGANGSPGNTGGAGAAATKASTAASTTSASATAKPGANGANGANGSSGSKGANGGAGSATKSGTSASARSTSQTSGADIKTISVAAIALAGFAALMACRMLGCRFPLFHVSVTLTAHVLELALASDEIVDVLHVCYTKWQIYERGSGCKKGHSPARRTYF